MPAPHDKIEEWILIRGLARHAGHWMQFPEIFKSKFPDATVLSPDLPGTGLRYKETSPRSVHALVESLRQTLGAPKGRRYLVGISLGGMITLDWASLYPREIAGAVVINTSARGLCSLSERLAPEARRLLTQAALKNIRGRELLALKATSNCPPTGDRLEQWLTVSERTPMSAINGLRQLVAAALFRLPETKPDAPLLVLASQADRLASPNCSRKISQAWGLPLQLHDWGGHDLTLDDPDWVANQILAWHSGSR